MGLESLFCWYVSLKDQNHFPLISEVVVYEVSTGERLRRLGRHKDTPLALGFSPSGEYLATWTIKDAVFWWNLGGDWRVMFLFIHIDLILYIYGCIHQIFIYEKLWIYRFCKSQKESSISGPPKPEGIFNKGRFWGTEFHNMPLLSITSAPRKFQPTKWGSFQDDVLGKNHSHFSRGHQKLMV